MEAWKCAMAGRLNSDLTSSICAPGHMQLLTSADFTLHTSVAFAMRIHAFTSTINLSIARTGSV